MALRRPLASRLMPFALALTFLALAPFGCSDGEPTATNGAGPGGTGGRGGAGGEGGEGGQAGAAPCDAGEKQCDGACVATSDPAFGCAEDACKPCSLPNATAACEAGACAVGACEGSFSNCDGNAANGCEVDTQTDPAQCGGCGNPCVVPNATPTCVAGACAVGVCKAGFTDCDGDVTNGCEAVFADDPKNCGSCGEACPPGESCVTGTCELVCAAGTASCDSDTSNGCETVLGTLTDCAFCGDACDPANASGACEQMSCGIGACDAGFEDCDNQAANGCEASVETSTLHCGACGNVCPSGPNGTAVCAAGACSLVCDAGFEDCDGDASTGCEQPTSADVQNCGGCGAACQTPNATPECSAGVCGIAACDAGFEDCNGVVIDGCEASLDTSATNCGACDNACPAPVNADPACSAGTCSFTCSAGFSDCDNDASNGCELPTSADVQNCGGCGVVCATPNGTPGCSAGTCVVEFCDAGFGNCDGQAANGCEVNTQASPIHCGACDNACTSPPNAAGVCAMGACTYGCFAGFGDCDGQAANGCEVNIASDAQSCGFCGNACVTPNATPMCAGGACGVAACDAGFGDCDLVAANGCEVDITSNVQSCGACGNACSLPNATPMCSGGACGVASCNAGFGDCDGQASNGCETSTTSDAQNCGACGVSCAAAFPNGTGVCTASACSFAGCAPGFYDADGNLANGCEYACSFVSATDDPDDMFVDANCDGVDGDASKAIFVAVTGNDANAGTRQQPMATVVAAIAKAFVSFKTHIYISEGIYLGRVSLSNNISLFGGYSAANGWARSAAYVSTIRNGTPQNGRLTAVEGANITSPTVVDRLSIETLSTALAGVSNYAMHCNGCSALTLKNSVLLAGSAGAGAAGTIGAQGANGSNGLVGGGGSCDGNTPGAAGGNGGGSSCGRTGGTGGKGGDFGANAGAIGGSGAGGTPGGGGGAGGDPGQAGGTGTTGASGSGGNNGGGGVGGAVMSAFWQGSPGAAGTAGTPGNGGGGGGGGAGGPSFAVYRSNTVVMTVGNILSNGAGGAGGISTGSSGAPGASGGVF